MCVVYAEVSSRIRRARLAASASPRDATDFTAKRSEVGRDCSATDGRSVGRSGRRTDDSWGGRASENNRGVFTRAPESGNRAVCPCAVCPCARAFSRRCAKSSRTPRVCACDLVHAPGPEVGCQRTRAAGYTLEEFIRGRSRRVSTVRERERQRKRRIRAEPVSRKERRRSKEVRRLLGDGIKDLACSFAYSSDSSIPLFTRVTSYVKDAYRREIVARAHMYTRTRM